MVSTQSTIPKMPAGFLSAKADRHSLKMEQQLISQLAQQKGVTEQLKAENQLEWVARRNNILNRADEIVLNDLIYA